MKNCPHRVQPDLQRRPVNGLCVEIGQPAARCKLLVPEEWQGREPSQGPSLADRWLRSGGSPLIFDPCDPGRCPLASS